MLLQRLQGIWFRERVNHCMKVLGVSIKGTGSEAKVQVVEDRAQQLRKAQDFGPKAREELLDQLFHVFMARVLCGARTKISYSSECFAVVCCLPRLRSLRTVREYQRKNRPSPLLREGGRVCVALCFQEV